MRTCWKLTCGDADVIVRAALRTADQRQVVRQDVLEKLVSSQSAVSHVLPAMQEEKEQPLHTTQMTQRPSRQVKELFYTLTICSRRHCRFLWGQTDRNTSLGRWCCCMLQSSETTSPWSCNMDWTWDRTGTVSVQCSVRRYSINSIFHSHWGEMADLLFNVWLSQTDINLFAWYSISFLQSCVDCFCLYGGWFTKTVKKNITFKITFYTAGTSIYFNIWQSPDISWPHTGDLLKAGEFPSKHIWNQ